MRETDKFLIGLVAGVMLLVGVVLAIALLRPTQSSYQSDDTPEGVAHNYLLALQHEDYERAYGYLSPTLRGYPADLERFERDVKNNSWNFGDYDGDVSLAIEEVNAGDEKARVVVRTTIFYPSRLFDSGQHSFTFSMSLRRTEGAWRITSAERYWASCWEFTEGCR